MRDPCTMRKPKPPFVPGNLPVETNNRQVRFDPKRPGRVCPMCKLYRENKDYQYARSKTCIPCKLRRVMKSERGQLAVAEARRAREKAEGLPAFTSTREGHNKYQREWYRANKMTAREHEGGIPLGKQCRQCKHYKPITEFGSWRIRICAACDGPSLDMLYRQPQRLRRE